MRNCALLVFQQQVIYVPRSRFKIIITFSNWPHGWRRCATLSARRSVLSNRSKREFGWKIRNSRSFVQFVFPNCRRFSVDVMVLDWVFGEKHLKLDLDSINDFLLEADKILGRTTLITSRPPTKYKWVPKVTSRWQPRWVSFGSTLSSSHVVFVTTWFY